MLHLRPYLDQDVLKVIMKVYGHSRKMRLFFRQKINDEI